ncbi:MAG: response regulator [Candidatus Electrothrix sp. GM3_4]|nr:response regulator [Candidatus Electrothrix sp. GM3_4]
MNSSLGSEIVTGFIEEVEGYLPDMSRCLQTLQQDREHRSSLAELHRITHTIKGAAAMVGLDDLSGIGEVLEKVMENVLGASLILDDETIALLGDATRRIDSYCIMQRDGRPDDGQLFQKTVAKIEEKLCKSTVESYDIEGGPESYNPETILFEESEESTEEESATTESALDALDNDLGLDEDSEDSTDDFFALSDAETLEKADADIFLDEDALSALPDKKYIEDDLLFQDFENIEEEEDDLFGSATTETEQFEAPKKNLTLSEPGQRGQEGAEKEDIDPELLECFREETEDHLENIDSCLNSLGIEITDSVELTPSTKETLHSLRRSVHTLKGAAAVIGIEQVAAWGHDFEDFLDWLHDEARRLDPPIIAALRDGADLLASLAEEPTSPAEQEKQRIIAKFEGITENFPSDTTVSEDDEGESEATDSSLVFDEAEKILYLNEDSAADFFAEDNSEASGEADSLFDEIASSVSPASAEENEDDDFDLFGSAATEIKQFEASEEPLTLSEPGLTGQENGEAEGIDPELLECFREETDEHLENIDDCLKRLGVQITAPVELTSTTRETLHSFRRSVHTLKGATAVIGIEQIAAWGYEFEDFLDWLHDEAKILDPHIIALLHKGADLLAELAKDPTCPVEQRKNDLTVLFKEIITGDQKKEGELGALLVGKNIEQETRDTADNFFDDLSVHVSDNERGDLFETNEDHTFNSSPKVATSTIGLELGEDIDAELFQCFHEEAEDHLENIDRQLNHLGMTVSGESELTNFKRGSLHSIRRSVHTLKGAAAVIGVEQVAAWGHNFEDFLDWLHDEARIIQPEVVKAMQEGADILVRLVEDPNCSVHTDQQKTLRIFGKITADNLEKSSFHDIKEETLPGSDVPASSEYVAEEKKKIAPARTRQQGQIKKTATLRVDVNRIDQMVGLSGDMVINLSSFEDSMDAMAGTMKELDMILQRLKNINSSLEAGYELDSIPHLGSQENTQKSGITEGFDPLEMDRYSELNILIRSLSEAVSDLDSIMDQNVLDNVAWQQTVERQGMVLKELQNRMIGVRMTPFSTQSSRMHRTVREAERTTGHPAQLTIGDESIMMDTRVWEVMADPLMHILRNAVAHGGSLPQKAGWAPLSITIQAKRKGGLCTLRVSDNGKGLNYEVIRIKGMKLYPNDRVNLMNDNELAELIFRHGFSSTGSITNIAGRGVGMDVVRDAIDQLNGSIELVSEQGQGTEFIMRLPVAVAQLPAIFARFGTQIYAIPMHDVASVARATPEEKKGREYTFDGKIMPLLHIANMPEFETDRGYVKEHLTEDDQALLIVHVGRKRAAVLCEQLIGQRDIVFKDLGSHLQNVPCISGVTIMGNGTLIPILQVEEVLRRWSSVTKRRDVEPAVRLVKERGPLRVLVVDDSISVRKVVSNFIVQQGWIPVAARNGIEAVEKIREDKPDVVLLDVEMPRMNGFEVLQTLQAQPELRDLPVAMLTSRSAEKYQQKARELGARGFMTKPFKPEEVIDFIRKVTAGEEV